MQIKVYRDLKPETVEAIRNLEASCKKADHLQGYVSLDLFLNLEALKGFYLAYEADRLLASIIVFAPSTAEAEISAFTDPSFRKQGLFKKLLAEAVLQLNKYSIKDLLFVCEADSESGKAVIAKINARYCFSEYKMNNTGEFQPQAMADGFRTTLVTPNFEDLNDLTGLRCEIFGESMEDAQLRIIKSLESETRHQYMLLYKGRAIGLCTAGFEEANVSIYGLGILPKYHGQGFGLELLQLAVKDLTLKGHYKLAIEVNSVNSRALKLYKRSGFQITATYDYYRLSLEDYTKSIDQTGDGSTKQGTVLRSKLCIFDQTGDGSPF